MSFVLGPNQYGKAENRVVRIYRDTERHEIRDLNVSTALRGDFREAHESGDQANVLPTDTQKNTAFAFAKEHGVTSPEDYALALGVRLLEATPAATASRIEVEEYPWDRIEVGGDGHDHAFVRRGGEVRTTVVTQVATGAGAAAGAGSGGSGGAGSGGGGAGSGGAGSGGGGGRRAWVVSGVKDLVVLKSTGSEFKGFLKDRYTTLQETDDRILATSLTARWRYESGPESSPGSSGGSAAVDWNTSFAEVRRILLETFATTYSRALQETLYAMGSAVLAARPEVAEITFSAPNKHHFLVDLSPFGGENNGEVFIAADRPYGLIEATVQREGGSDAGDAWLTVPGFS